MRTLLAAFACFIVLAGCAQVSPEVTTTGDDLEAEPGAAAETDGPGTPAAPAADPSVPRPNVTHGVAGNTTTKGDVVAYTVSTTGPVTVTIRLNRTVFDTRVVDADAEWNLTLPYGRTPLNVTIQGPGLSVRDDVTLVRLAPTTLTIDYCHFHGSSPSQRKVDTYEHWVDLDSRPSASLYHSEGAKPKDAFTVHDQLVVFEETTGIPVVVEYSASFSGFFVEYIDGAGNAASSDAPPYWLYEVNGTSPSVGMSLMPVAPHDHVRWVLSTLGPPCE